MWGTIQGITFQWMKDLKLNLTLTVQKLHTQKETLYQMKYKKDNDNHFLLIKIVQFFI